tara:strand:+ start:441247 stop:441456 length:210 start_codon:yes stop_codon:yes gene_type:complete
MKQQQQQQQYKEVTLNEAEQFRVRMRAQCLQVESYRLTVQRNEGRCLTRNEAALEWIERYAARFDVQDI